jgi:hypothetical protein
MGNDMGTRLGGGKLSNIGLWGRDLGHCLWEGMLDVMWLQQGLGLLLQEALELG